MPVEIVPIQGYSDGDATHRPKSEWSLVSSPSLYLEKLAILWKQRRGEELHNGYKYYLDRLPAGYALFERPRPKNAQIIDRHLYGHPRHKFFDSPNRFFPHFEHLMKNGSNLGCPCTVCAASGSTAIPIGVKQSSYFGSKRTINPKIKAAVQQHKDEEGNPDMVRQLVDRLRVETVLDQPILEPRTMDWRVEHALLPTIIHETVQKPTWFPRVGELVLFWRVLPQQASQPDVPDKDEAHKPSYSSAKNPSRWEAGVVSQTAGEQLSVEDLRRETSERHSIIYSGFRIEPLPDPNERQNKALSKSYLYVSLHHIRPLVFYAEILRKVKEEFWHPSIHHALTVMSSVSVVDKFRFTGTWPSANIECRGMFLGSELICVGDVVRLMPSITINSPVTSKSANVGMNVTDVMEITAIRFCLTNLDKASSDDYDDGHPYNSTIYVLGKAFTVSLDKAWVVSEHDFDVPHTMKGTGKWHRLHDPGKFLKVPFSKVLGRLYDATAVNIWFGESDSLSPGIVGTQKARAFSAKRDRRILEGKSWFWGDSRAEVLDVESFNSIDVSYRDETRDPETLHTWRKGIKILERNLAIKVSEAEESGSKIWIDGDVTPDVPASRETDSSKEDEEQEILDGGPARASEIQDRAGSSGAFSVSSVQSVEDELAGRGHSSEDSMRAHRQEEAHSPARKRQKVFVEIDS